MNCATHESTTSLQCYQGSVQNRKGVVVYWRQQQLPWSANTFAAALLRHPAPICGEVVVFLPNGNSKSPHTHLEELSTSSLGPHCLSIITSHHLIRPPPKEDDIATTHNTRSIIPFNAYEPRQQLLWTIAGEASSMSFEPRVSTAVKVQMGGTALQTLFFSIEKNDHSPWTTINSELLALVIKSQSYSSALTHLMCQVCTGWRKSIGHERGMLSQLQFAYTLKYQPSDINKFELQRRKQTLPWLLIEAISAGCETATLAVARFYNIHYPEMALKYWICAAKMGVTEAQLEVGRIYYRGLCGAVRDPSEASMWLNRCAKSYVDKLHKYSQSLRHGSCRANICTFTGAETAALREACTILGYLYLDGEVYGGTPDTANAMKWLCLASHLGSQEAESMIGSMWNTGQF